MRTRLHTAQHAGIKRILEVGNDDAEIAGPSGDETLRCRVGTIGQVACGSQYALERLFAHEPRLGQRA